MNSKAANQTLEYLEKLPDEQVMQMRAPVQELLRSHGWKLIEDILEKRIADTRTLMEFGAHEHAEYTMFIGELRGMQTVPALIQAVLTGSERAAQRAAQTAAQEEAAPSGY